jgi:molecular chaperone DnaK
MLKVTARERATGLMKNIVIENALAQFEQTERDSARERLEELWEDPEDFEDDGEDAGDEAIEGEASGGEVPELVAGPREGQRETVQARALLEKAERLLDRISAEDKVEVERLMERIRTAMTDRQWTQLTQASNELADVLFYLEDA